MTNMSDIQVTYGAVQEALDAGRAWGEQKVELYKDQHDGAMANASAWTRGMYCGDLPGVAGETLHDTLEAIIDLEAERIWNEARSYVIVMTKEELLKELEVCAKSDDTEGAHVAADNALINFIDDIEIADAYRKIRKWYA
jgi:hypothetical protein